MLPATSRYSRPPPATSTPTCQQPHNILDQIYLPTTILDQMFFRCDKNRQLPTPPQEGLHTHNGNVWTNIIYNVFMR